MQFRREKSHTSLSPLRMLYGRKNERLILPLDICIVLERDGKEVLFLPASHGIHNNDPIVNTGGGELGRIGRYDFPPANMFEIQPYTEVISNIPVEMVPLGQAPAVNAQKQDIVEIEILNDSFEPTPTGVRGNIVQLPMSYAYPDLAHRVTAYHVHFNQRLRSVQHGSRVVMVRDRSLLGMLFVTENKSDGTCETLVFPAHLL